MKNQSNVIDNDGNNGDLIMENSGITIDLYLDRKCDDDAKYTQPDPKIILMYLKIY